MSWCAPNPLRARPRKPMDTHMAQADPVAEARRWLATDPDRAARLARAILAKVPGSVGAQFVLASARRRLGDAAGAIAVLDRLTIPPALAWGLQFERGMALAALGDVAGAIVWLERSVAGNPGQSLAWHALGEQLMVAGRRGEAAAARARSAAGDARLEDAVFGWVRDGGSTEALHRSFGLDTIEAASVCLIADVGARSGAYDPIVVALRELLAVAQGHHPARLHLAVALHRQAQDAEALAVITPLLAALPDLAPARALCGTIRVRLGNHHAASEDFRVAVESDPDDAHYWLGYGHALRAVGRQDDAVAAYRRAITIEPALGEAYWSLANLKTWRFVPYDLERMRSLLDDAALGAEARGHLHFALGKALDDAGRFEEAFAQYAQGNAVRRATTLHDAAAHGDFVRRTITAFDARFLAERGTCGRKDSGAIFVVGMPRSGSTLVEQILASHSAVEGASELPDIMMIAEGIARRATPGCGYPEMLADIPSDQFAQMGDEYLRNTRAKRPLGRAYFVDKLPGNFLHTGLIHLMLPDARIIDVRRDPRDCCVSLFTQQFAAGQGYSYDLADLGHYCADYVRLMRHFDTVLPGRILRVRYEALVGDFEPQVRRLLDHCGLPFEPGVLRFFDNDRAVATPSSEQVRQPIYTHGLGRWRRFAPWLGPMHDALGPIVDQGTRSA